MNYDLEMKVRFCSKHKKLFDSSFVKVGRIPCIEVNAFCKAWKQAEMCPQCRWKTAWGEDLKQHHYKPVKWPIDHEGCLEAPKPIGLEPKTPQPGVEDEETAEEYEPDHDAQKSIIEKRPPRRKYMMKCHMCGKEVDTNNEIFLLSSPCIFGLRVRCLKCGKAFQRCLPSEFRERWINI